MAQASAKKQPAIKGKLLAKGNGLTLIDHSSLVARIAVKIAQKTRLDISANLIEGIRISGLLHDIGKCTAQFQKRLSKLSCEDENLEAKLPYLHNEVGWAFLSRYLLLPKDILSIVLDSTYWHHGIMNKMCGYLDTDMAFSEDDIEAMMGYLKSIVGEDCIRENLKPRQSPRYYVAEEMEEADIINAERLFTRTCIISADRLASGFDNQNITDEEIDAIIGDANRKCTDIDLSKHIHFGNDRFILQQSIVDLCGKTTQINAPAGFGKTLLGLLWGFKSNRKLIWVCPHNIVAESVYKSILSELVNFGIKLSVELYLAGEVEECNTPGNNFSSDIIVTNIDNYLAPSVNNKYADRLFTIIDANVVFDEFHELIGEVGLFACFVNIMRTRNRLTNANTLLLSATPTLMRFLWNSHHQKTLVLPNETSHYPAVHKKEYKFKVTTELNVADKDGNNLIMLNAVSNAQRYTKIIDTDILLHSRFEDEHRSANTKKLYKYYGKESDRNAAKPNIVGTPVVQNSLDVSFTNLYESVLSPQATLQRLGRCDRWGDCPNESSITVANVTDGSISSVAEVAVRGILYENGLSNKWFEHISVHSGRKLIQDEFYRIYNDFESINSAALKKYLLAKHSNSLKRLSLMHPVKFFNTNKSDIKTAGGKKLRSSNSEIFVICKYYNSDRFTDPINVQIRNSFDKDFDEGSNIGKLLKNTMKKLRDANDTRFDFSAILNNKKITIDAIRRFAQKSNTPYIRFDKVYHPKYGEIDKALLAQLNK